MGEFQQRKEARIPDIDRPESLFHHLFGDASFADAYLVTASNVYGVPNSWRNRSWRYPEQATNAAEWLIDEAQLEKDAYFGVHLYQESGNRRASNAFPTVTALWMDEDEGHYPEDGPQPTAIVRSSSRRRHLYWRLAYPVAIEWAVDLNKRIAEFSGGDSTKAVASSVLRAAGTGNYKRATPDLVVGHFTGAEVWDPIVMDQAIPPMPEPDPPPTGARGAHTGPAIDLAPYLEAVEVLGEVADGLGKKRAIVCPWVSEHSGGDRSGTYVGQRADGGLWFFCNHSHCEGRSWREFRSQLRARAKMMNIRRGSRKHAKTKEVRVRRG